MHWQRVSKVISKKVPDRLLFLLQSLSRNPDNVKQGNALVRVHTVEDMYLHSAEVSHLGHGTCNSVQGTELAYTICSDDTLAHKVKLSITSCMRTINVLQVNA